MNCLAVIPARYASQRLPGKVLLPLGAKTILQHVYERTASVPGIGQVVVATDDDRVLRCVEGFGGAVCMTSPDHRSGSDRVAEAVADSSAEWVLNVQGDEPFIEPDTLQRLLKAADRFGAPVLTAAAPIGSMEEWAAPSVVKVVVDRQGRALYFSRWPIPHARRFLGAGMPERPEQLDDGILGAVPFLRHIGVYLYRRDFLLQFVRWERGPLEEAEQLEQLRILEQGHTVQVVVVDRASMSVDTLEDYQKARQIWEWTDGRGPS